MRTIRVTVGLCMALGVEACAPNWPAPVVERGPRAGAQKPKPAPAKPVAIAKQAPTVAPLPGGSSYVVKRGDTLYSIALEHGADYRDVAQWNHLDDPTKVSPGQVLRVKAPEERAVQVGRPSTAGRIESRPIAGAAPPSQPAPAAKAEAKAEAKTQAEAVSFIWPVKGKVLAGFAERRSKGIDIDGRIGDPVMAAASGRVTYTGSGIPGLGKLVVIRHDNGFITVYAHNKDIVVKEQQAVTRGQKIAEIGSSDSDRPKLHFQIRKGSAAVDPLRYLPGS